jgi:hypothetical protein
VVGNCNLSIPLSFGAWIVGGIISNGDVALDPGTIAKQVRLALIESLSIGVGIFFTHPSAKHVLKFAL